MSTDRKLAWAGVILALPGLIALFRDEDYKISTLVLLLLLIVSSFLVYLQQFTKRPQITIKKLTKTLVIHDTQGRLATLNRCQEFVPNYHHIQRIWFRDIVGDGMISSPLIDGLPPSHQEQMGCLLSVAKEYRGPLVLGDPYSVTLTYDLVNSFPALEEGLLHDVAVDTRILILEVRLPKGRPCKKATLHLLAGGEPMQALPKKASISADRLQLRTEVKHPKPGYTYELSWEW